MGDTEEAEPAQSATEDGDSDDSAFQIVCEYIALCFSALFVLVTFPLSLPIGIKIISQYERGVKVRLGRNRNKQLLQPGVVFVFPCVDALWIQDVRTRCYSTPSQQVLTKDSVTVKIDAVLRVDVIDAYQCIIYGQGSDIVKGMATRRVLTCLRSICGQLTLTEIINGRERVQREIMKALKRWGKSINISQVEIKNISLPKEMEQSMASEALTTRQAKATVIAADGEVRSSRKLKEAADIISASPQAFHLQYLHSLRSISKKTNKTVVLPIPTHLLNMITQARRK